ncbi:MAG TPA: glutamyl-tRNA amidotransferase, partial [Propionibacteriaceae bacterium]|nr:glutamyl-tRNA amidotransferase [Propionibacteriaceae bacterium]
IVDEEVAASAAALGERPTMKQMGGLIKAVNGRVAGRFEGGKVAAMVKAALA